MPFHNEVAASLAKQNHPTIMAIINGNASDNGLTGTSVADLINGFAGNDTLNGGTGADTLIGGTGNDTYYVDNLGDVLQELPGEGIDTVNSTVSWTLGANLENLRLTSPAALVGTGNGLNNEIRGNSQQNTLYGLGGDDRLIGDYQADVLDGGTGNDTMDGGFGNDTFHVDSIGDVVLELPGQGLDTVISSISLVLYNNVENLRLLEGSAATNGTGNALGNALTGNSAGNRLSGLAGNDTIDGGAGNDTMEGGEGSDLYHVDSAGDVILNETAAGGLDTVRSGLTFTLPLNVENLELLGSANLNGTGNASNNRITGNSGNNVLDGKTGADTMIGGLGNDRYFVDHAGDYVSEPLGGGVDTMVSTVSKVLPANVENLELGGAAAINGAGNTQANTITGNNANNHLSGGDGNDTLHGAAGNDTMAGGSGNDIMNGGAGDDIYEVDSQFDLIVETPTGGNDIVVSSATYVLSANVEQITLLGAANIGASGNDGANRITGNSGNNLLSGAAGNDTITGGDGADTMNGGLGNDSLNAGAGNDVLDGGAGVDTLNGGLGNDTYTVDNSGDRINEAPGEGTDSVVATASYTLPGNVENLTLVGPLAAEGTGNIDPNAIAGNALANTLKGLQGSDVLTGLDGNDTLVGANEFAGRGLGEIDFLTGGTGNDVFVLGTAGGRFYDEGNPFNHGIQDMARILDFNTGDRLQIKGAASSYFVLSATTYFGPIASGVSERALVHDSNGNGVFDSTFLGGSSSDELIALIQGPAANTALANAIVV